jgi:hypothetical protein
MTTTVLLVQSLGGGWTASELACAAEKPAIEIKNKKP